MVGSSAKEYPLEYFSAAAMAATINYPLWRASAIGQAGWDRVSTRAVPVAVSGIVQAAPAVAPFLYAFAPPYKGMSAVILGMTWARAAIFWGSDVGKDMLKAAFPTAPSSFHTIAPPLLVSSAVQCINQPIVRASITLQNPESHLPNTRGAIRYIYNNHGLGGLWHGTSSPTYSQDNLFRSACKSSAAGVAGAALTNPFDVIRNEMFKSNMSLVDTVKSLHKELGWKFMARGIGKNMVAVAIPIACTIFFTDALIQKNKKQKLKGGEEEPHRIK